MFSDSLCRWNVASEILGISALLVTAIAGGCTSGKGYGGGGGGGGTPSLTATVAGTGAFSLGQGATYEITVSNTGTAATSGTVTVADPPTGFTITVMSGANWTCTLATTTCTTTYVVAAAQSFPPITVTGNVTSPNGTSVTIPLTLSGGGAATVDVTPTPSIAVVALTCSSLPLLGNENLFNGTHIATLSGWKDKGGPTQAVAAFVANGAGVVTSGEMDSGTVVVDGTSQSAPTLSTISNGCYQVGLDDRGLMLWNFTGGGSLTFAISISPKDQVGLESFLLEFDDANPGTSPGTRLAGRIYFQTPGPYTLASFSGPFAFFTTGYYPNSGNADYLRTGTIGRLDDSATGAVTNGALNIGLTTAPGTQANFDNQNFTGTFSPPDALGRGILTLNFTTFGTLGATIFNFAYYIDDPNDLYLQSIDTPDTAGHSLQNGDVVTQFLSSPPAVFNATASLFMIGADIGHLHSYTVTAVGQVTGDGLGGSTSRLDEVSDGSVIATGTNTISGGSFAVSSNGMGVLTVGSGASAQSFSIAMFSQNGGYVLEGTTASPGSHILTGAFRQHTNSGGVFDNGTFSGAYIFGPHKQASTKSVFAVGSVMVPTPPTNPTSFSGMTDESSAAGCNTGCLSVDHAVSGTYSVDANGRITILPGLTGGTSVGWFENNGHTLVLISDTGDANGTILNVND